MTGHESPAIVIEPPGKLALPSLPSLWAYRDLFIFLAWRDIALKYKQTALGAVWPILQPLLATALFTIIFSRLAGMSSDGIPYPVFAFSGLLFWLCFAAVLARVSNSLSGNAHLLSKVYFPRLIIPFATALPPLLDFGVGMVVLGVLLAVFRVTPAWQVVFIPAWLALAVVTSMGIGLWLSALNVRWRDIGNIVPFMIQVGMFASPIFYPVSAIPPAWRSLYSLNPMVGILEGARWSLFGTPLRISAVVTSTVVALLFFGAGVVFFTRTERTFADVV